MRDTCVALVAVGVSVLFGCEKAPLPKLDPLPEEASPVAGLRLPGQDAPGQGATTGSPGAGPALANVVEARATGTQEDESCPAGMVLVEGSYCPRVEHRCLEYLDAPGRYAEFRCARYAQPAKCLSPRVDVRFCIDRDEYVPPGEALPANFKSFTHAKKTCEADGKRVCLESEWNFACEGEEMRPYPYGWERDSSACNADHADIIDQKGELKDRRARADEYPQCVSPFGVRNLSGNLEEFVARDGTNPPAPAMKGAYWQPGRNFCRAAQTAHDRYYNGMETGFRCCADAD